MCHENPDYVHWDTRLRPLAPVAGAAVSFALAAWLVSLIGLAVLVGVAAGIAGLALMIAAHRIVANRNAVVDYRIRHGIIDARSAWREAAQRDRSRRAPALKAQAQRVHTEPQALSPGSVYPWGFPWPQNAPEGQKEEG